MSFSVFYSQVSLLHFQSLMVYLEVQSWVCLRYSTLVFVGPNARCVHPTPASQLWHTANSAMLKSTDSVVCARSCDKLIIKVFPFGCVV